MDKRAKDQHRIDRFLAFSSTFRAPASRSALNVASVPKPLSKYSSSMAVQVQLSRGRPTRRLLTWSGIPEPYSNVASLRGSSLDARIVCAKSSCCFVLT